MGMQFWVTFTTELSNRQTYVRESMLVQCKQINYVNYVDLSLVNSIIPGVNKHVIVGKSDDVGMKCILPNGRGYLKFKLVN